MEVNSIYSSTALLSLISANFCPEVECSHAQIILPKHVGWQPSVYTQDNPWSKFLFSVLASCFLCCSWQMVPQGQKQHGFITMLLGWLLITARSGCRLLWCLSLSMLQLPPHIPQPEQQKMEKAVTPHGPLLPWEPATEKLHLIIASGQCWATFMDDD